MGDKFKNVKVKINGNIMEVDLEVLVEGNVNTATYDDGWSKRDSIPVNSDPIGDVDDSHYLDALRYVCSSVDSGQEDFGTFDNEEKDPYVESYKKWKKDQDEYEKMMAPRLIVPEGKVSFDKFRGYPYWNEESKEEVEEPKCDCGTFAVHGKVPLKAHANYCELITGKK